MDKHPRWSTLESIGQGIRGEVVVSGFCENRKWLVNVDFDVVDQGELRGLIDFRY